MNHHHDDLDRHGDDQHDEHQHDGPTFVATLTRRRALGMLAAVGLGGVLAACGSDDNSSATTSPDTTTRGTIPPGTDSPASTTSPSTTAAATASTTATASSDVASAVDCVEFPEETNGPFPADGSNDNGERELADVLADSRVVRSDLTTNLDGSDQQPGIPLTLTMVVTAADGCTPLPGAAVYAWHCNRDGHYSVYSGGMNGGDYSDASWFRGVQIAGADGGVTFQTIFPGRYQGRATHIHFEVYADDSYGDLLLTSQIGFDDAEADAAYATDSNYASSLSNPTYNASDNIFADGDGRQILDLDDSAGLAAHVVVGV